MGILRLEMGVWGLIVGVLGVIMRIWVLMGFWR